MNVTLIMEVVNKAVLIRMAHFIVTAVMNIFCQATSSIVA